MFFLPLKNPDSHLASKPIIRDLDTRTATGEKSHLASRPNPTRKLVTNTRRLFSFGESDAGASKAAASDNTVVTDPDELQALVDRYTSEIELSDGTPVRLRPVLPQDKEKLQSGMARMSEESRYRRFMSLMTELPPGLLQHLTELDYDNHFALAALTLKQQPPEGIGVARYVRDMDKPHVAEPAVTIIDSHQGYGLGHQLLDRLMAAALEHGITHFRATLFADNEPMKQLFLQQGATLEYAGYGELVAEFALPQTTHQRKDFVYELVRQAYYGVLKGVHHALPYPLNL